VREAGPSYLRLGLPARLRVVECHIALGDQDEAIASLRALQAAGLGGAIGWLAAAHCEDMGAPVLSPELCGRHQKAHAGDQGSVQVLQNRAARRGACSSPRSRRDVVPGEPTLELYQLLGLTKEATPEDIRCGGAVASWG
jgi:hypothetical protein